MLFVALLKIFASAMDVLDHRVAIVDIVTLLNHDIVVALVMLAMVLRGRVLVVVRGGGRKSFYCSNVPSTGRMKHLSSTATWLLLVLLMVPTGSCGTLMILLLVHDAYHRILRRPNKHTPSMINISSSLHIFDGGWTPRVNQLLKK